MGFGDSIKGIFDKIKRSLFIDKKLIEEVVKELQKSLIRADVNVKRVFEITKEIKEKLLNEKVPETITPKDYLIKLIYEKLIELVGNGATFEVKKPYRMLLVGLYGSGKTTFAAKVGNYYKKRGHKVAMVSLDVWRPAAYEQLLQLGKQVGIDVFGDKKEKNPKKIYEKFEKQLNDYDFVIFDSAGRDALSDELIDEIKTINKITKPDISLMVMSADLGQAAENQAKTFHEAVGINGVIITKMDGTAKGGGALSACAIAKVPVYFLGVGEKVDDIEVFDPSKYIGRLLGMGDIESLVEKINTEISEEDQQKYQDRIKEGKFTLTDLYEQMKNMKKMGGFKKIMGFMPGFSGAQLPKEFDVEVEKLDIWGYIIDSMTEWEKENPEEIHSSRIKRIASGSGRNETEVRDLIKRYKQMKKVMKMMKGDDPEKLMKKMMKGGIPKGMKF